MTAFAIALILDRTTDQLQLLLVTANRLLFSPVTFLLWHVVIATAVLHCNYQSTLLSPTITNMLCVWSLVRRLLLTLQIRFQQF